MKTTISVLVTLVLVLSGAVGVIYYQKMVFDSALQTNSEKVTKLQTELDAKQAELTQAQSELQSLQEQNSTETSLPITIVGANAINVNIDDQTSDRNTVNVDFAILEAPGYVVIHRDNNGTPGDVIGYSVLLSAGTTQNVVINLDQTKIKLGTESVLVGGEEFYAMLHLDNGDGVYTAVDEDLPAKDSLGNVVMMKSQALFIGL